MNTISIYEPAGCCATSNVAVDEKSLAFNADMDWCKARGIRVERFNLLKQPAAFVSNTVVKDFLTTSGQQSLPLVLVNGQIVLAGRLPVRDELKRWSGVDVAKSDEDFPPSCCNVPRMP